jgi:hypothetical protein
MRMTALTIAVTAAVAGMFAGVATAEVSSHVVKSESWLGMQPQALELILQLPPSLPGDANGDGKVNFIDYFVLENGFGKSGMTWERGDFSGDGKVGFVDYLILEANYGKVPEPATLSLLVIGVLAILRRRPG